MIEKIEHNGALFALIVRTSFVTDGIKFFTPNEFSQQLAYMKRPANWRIEPHTHNPVMRSVEYTHEVLFIKSGRVRVDFYESPTVYLESRILGPGDVILLAHGGHGFTMLEETEMIEVKQGPYSSDADKTRFTGIDDAAVKIPEEST
jgi:mannose-6-phosphate isomerase-like protein (cupin superfamily)